MSSLYQLLNSFAVGCYVVLRGPLAREGKVCLNIKYSTKQLVKEIPMTLTIVSTEVKTDTRVHCTICMSKNHGNKPIGHGAT